MAGGAPVHEVVSLSIDDDTGTAWEDFLWFIERAGPCALGATVTLLDADVDGRPLVWDEGRRRAARLLLALSGLLVRGIGSDCSNGDGASSSPGCATRDVSVHSPTRRRKGCRSPWESSSPG